jgi:O-antigen/teichoic acid export membrane protein
MTQRGQRLLEAAQKPLPEGTFAVGAGLMVAGVTTYGFQILGFRALSKTDYAALNALWVFVFVLAPGIFLPLEQEVGRAIAARRVKGIGGGPVARRAAALGLAFAVTLAILAVAVAAFTPIVSSLFAGNAGLVVCLIISLFTYGFELLARGVFAGHGRFGAYGVSMAAEGTIRLVPVVFLAAAGVPNPLWYGLCLALPPMLATFVAMRGQKGLLPPGPDAPWSELSTNMSYLLFGSLFAQVLSYAPFLGAQVLATSSQRSAVADFIVGLFLSRIPILLFQAVQAALLPKLASLVSAGRNEEFRAGVRNLVVVVVAIGALGVLGGATLGPFVGKILFGSKFNLNQLDLALLAAGSGLFILALTLAQALIALLGHARAMLGWLAGIIVFTVVTAVAGNSLFLRVEIGSIAGAGAAAGLMAIWLTIQLRAGIPQESLAALVEQIEHEPLEI